MEQYRVLVVEDEYWIRKSICTLIEQVFQGAITAVESGSGEEALGRMAEEKISFVVTDISMPFMDGITLISHITEKYPDVPVLVLSGYSDFPLVRKALTGGALDYLLKPVKASELQAAVEKVKEVIERRKEEQETAARRQRQEQMYDDYARDLMLSTYICRRGSGVFADLKSSPKEQFRELSFPVYMAVIQSNSREIISGSDKTIWEKRYAGKRQIAERMEVEGVWGIENAYRQGEYILFSEKRRETLEKGCLNLKNYRQKGETFRICLGERLKKAEEIPNAYRDCLLKLMSNAEYGKEYQYMSMEVQDKKFNPNHRISKELEDELIQAFHQNSRSMLEYLVLEKLGIRRVKEDGWLIWEIEQVFSHLRSLIQSFYISKLGMYEMWEADSLFDSAERAVIAADTEEMLELTRQIFSVLIQEKDSEADSGFQAEGGILRVIEYVGKHYTENLTLSFLAEKFFLAPAYLSRSFKKRTGKNLIAYMTEKRLEKAVEYIKIKEMSLTEIAFLVGYSDYTYFNKVFRRYMGVSPTQFRDSV